MKETFKVGERVKVRIGKSWGSSWTPATVTKVTPKGTVTADTGYGNPRVIRPRRNGLYHDLQKISIEERMFEEWIKKRPKATSLTLRFVGMGSPSPRSAVQLMVDEQRIEIHDVSQKLDVIERELAALRAWWEARP